MKLETEQVWWMTRAAQSVLRSEMPDRPACQDLARVIADFGDGCSDPFEIVERVTRRVILELRVLNQN